MARYVMCICRQKHVGALIHAQMKIHVVNRPITIKRYNIDFITLTKMEKKKNRAAGCSNNLKILQEVF